MKGIKLPAKFSNVDINRSEGEEIKKVKSNKKLLEIRDTVDTKSLPLLKVQGLTTRFEIKQGIGSEKGMVHAVENIDFSLQPGETLGLVGESGCGKTTTARCILRAIDPTSGEILFKTKDGEVVDVTGQLGGYNFQWAWSSGYVAGHAV